MAFERNDQIVIEINHCLAYRKFAKWVNLVSITLENHIYFSLWETTQTLFWAAFGLIDLDNFELSGIKEFTRFWGLIMFGTFSIINIIVLLNLLIAMMNHSYQLISVSSVSFQWTVKETLHIKFWETPIQFGNCFLSYSTLNINISETKHKILFNIYKAPSILDL